MMMLNKLSLLYGIQAVAIIAIARDGDLISLHNCCMPVLDLLDRNSVNLKRTHFLDLLRLKQFMFAALCVSVALCFRPAIRYALHAWLQ